MSATNVTRNSGLRMSNVISVVCPPDRQLHLAPYEHGLGTSSYTLCLEKWKDREPCRQDSEFCQECLEKWREQR